tara:strand:+ start:677 stop:1690 length:1014 start_codon:yes stop_codon:yes gene_type:complete
MDEQEDHYSGETDEKGEPHGRGSMHYANGGWLESYEGEWRNGKRHGHGKLSSTEFRLEGEWRDGQIHGFGIKTYFTGEKFSGEFRDGTEYKGSMVFVDGEIYDGEWSNGRPGGRGVIVYADFARYEGDVHTWGDEGWKRTQDYSPHGEGEMRYTNGAIHTGKWHSGIPIDLFEGDLLDGLPNGHGTLTTLDGDRYEGQWEGGLPHGRGMKQWDEGRSRFEGEWERGFPHGHGRMTWVRKVRGEDSEFEETLECQFIRMAAHGKGTLTLGTITLEVEIDNDAPIRLIDHNGPGEVTIELKDNLEIVDYVDRIRDQLEYPLIYYHTPFIARNCKENPLT